MKVPAHDQKVVPRQPAKSVVALTDHLVREGSQLCRSLHRGRHVVP
jgi:hypothetical protein